MRKIILFSSVFMFLFVTGSSNCMQQKNGLLLVGKKENNIDNLSSVQQKLIEVQIAYDLANEAEKKAFEKVNLLKNKKSKVRVIQILLGLTVFASIYKDFVDHSPALFFLPLGIILFLLESHRPTGEKFDYIVKNFGLLFTSKWFLDLSFISGYVATSMWADKIGKLYKAEEKRAIKSSELKDALLKYNYKVKELLNESSENFTQEDRGSLRRLYLQNKEFKKRNNFKKLTYYPVKFNIVMMHVFGDKKEVVKI